jgi:hypothetical protein
MTCDRYASFSAAGRRYHGRATLFQAAATKTLKQQTISVKKQRKKPKTEKEGSQQPPGSDPEARTGQDEG